MMTGCRISEEDARDSHFDGLTDAEERAIATREHMERRDTLKEWVHGAKEKVDKMLEYGEFAPDADDILQAEQLNSFLDWHMQHIKKWKVHINDYR